MKRTLLFIALLLAASLHLPASAHAHHEQIVAGAGPSTKVVELFFKHFAKDPACKDYNFSVMPTSVKHKGGILSSDKYLFGRTGRPLNAKELAMGKGEILLGKVPIAFATGLEAEASILTLQQLKRIFTRQVTNWKEVGGHDAPILLVGREPSEALFLELKKDYPFFKKVQFDKIFLRDGDVVKFLNSPAGGNAIGFGANPNFTDYNRIPVEGFSAGVALGLVYDQKQAEHPVIKAAQKFAASPEWKSLLPSLDMLPAN